MCTPALYSAFTRAVAGPFWGGDQHYSVEITEILPALSRAAHSRPSAMSNSSSTDIPPAHSISSRMPHSPSRTGFMALRSQCTAVSMAHTVRWGSSSRSACTSWSDMSSMNDIYSGALPMRSTCSVCAAGARIGVTSFTDHRSMRSQSNSKKRRLGRWNAARKGAWITSPERYSVWSTGRTTTGSACIRIASSPMGATDILHESSATHAWRIAMQLSAVTFMTWSTRVVSWGQGRQTSRIGRALIVVYGVQSDAAQLMRHLECGDGCVNVQPLELFHILVLRETEIHVHQSLQAPGRGAEQCGEHCGRHLHRRSLAPVDIGQDEVVELAKPPRSV
ncbi:hypothetical protein BD779DRAFT_1214996 [Infundibulicybe gibba]|nr:hypothetical protein BD779DRAFT_1214996 [Infundibulicybe gibba]